MITNIKIVGSGAVCLRGIAHGLNALGQPVCGVYHVDDRLYGDEWFDYTKEDQPRFGKRWTMPEIIGRIDCKRCKAIARDNPPQQGEKATK